MCTYPPPRQSGRIKLNFTRYFKTPMRESKRAEEEDWLVRNRKHLYKNPKAKDITEQDPHWLKDKADEFYRSRDYQGAVNAYTAAIQADSEFVPAYSNRAACYLRLEFILSERLYGGVRVAREAAKTKRRSTYD